MYPPSKHALFASEKPRQCAVIWYTPQIPWGTKVYINKKLNYRVKRCETTQTINYIFIGSESIGSLPGPAKQPSFYGPATLYQRSCSLIQYGVKERTRSKTLQEVFASLWAMAGWPKSSRKRSWRTPQQKPCTTYKKCSNRRKFVFFVSHLASLRKSYFLCVRKST